MKKSLCIIMLLFIAASLFSQSAMDYFSMAEKARKNYEYQKAIEYYKKAGELWLEDGIREFYAIMQNKIGYLYKGLGKYDLALEYYERALAVDEELGDDKGVATDLSNIGAVYQAKGDFDLALEYYKRALPIDEELGDKAAVAVDLNNIGTLYQHWGKYDLALEYYERVIAAFEDLEQKNAVATVLNNIGMVYQSWGKYDLALEYYERALVLDEGLGDKVGAAISLNNIGLVYQTLGKYGQALEYYERTLSIVQELEDKAGVALCLNNIGGVYQSWGKNDPALEYFNRALSIREELGDKAGVAISLNNIGLVYQSSGKYGLALEYYNRSLAIGEELGKKAEIAGVLSNIGGVYYVQQKFARAIEYFRRSIDIIEQLRLTASGEVRRDYLASQIDAYQLLIDAEIRSGLDDEVFITVEQAKARYLSEKIGEVLNVEELTLKTAQNIRRELLPDEAILVFANMSLSKPAVLCITREKIQVIEVEKNTFIESIGDKYGDDIRFTLELKRGVQVSGQQKDAEENENAFEDIITYYRHHLTLGNPTRSEKEQREKIGRELYKLLISPIEQHLENKTKLLIVPDGVLGFLPFETFIDSSGRYLVEQYSIRYTQSLAVSDLIARRKYDAGKKPLLAFGGAVYETDGGSPRGSGKDKSSAGKQGGRAGGDGESVVSHKEITYAISRGAEYIGDVYDRMGLRWSDLPGTLEEVRDIGEMFPGSSIYTGEKVNEAMVKQLSVQGKLKQYEILHFSTHGMVVPQYPELSALVLSQTGIDDESGGGGSAGRGKKESRAASGGSHAGGRGRDRASGGRKRAEDGYLCMAEIAALDIEAEFVNLSACETGLGKIYAGEGVVGLTQSFLIAGANGLSVSLWQVADESTKVFMVGMYRKVKDEGLSYAEAIRQMKLEFLGVAPAGAERGGAAYGGAPYGGKYTNPFYWAPFVYYGE